MCHFPIGILGQVWYLIVSIPDLCTLTYFGLQYVNVAFPGLTQLLFAICLALLHSYGSFQISTNGT